MRRRTRRRRPSPALLLAIVALVAAVGGTAVAEGGATISGLSHGEKKQVKKLIRKIANKRARKISDKRITARAPKLSVASAKDASAVNGHAAQCPAGTTLIGGYCFDTAARGPAAGVFAASDDCANNGGFLPTTLMLRSVRGKIDLGNGPAPDASYTDSIIGTGSTTVVVFNNGGVSTTSTLTASEYHCAYPLLK